MDVVALLRTALAGRYTIEHEIGRGGMATVYLARDVRHERRVALKVLSPELGAILGVERFLSEIKVTANLQHPNLLPLFDSGEAEGLLFYAMPFVDGETLRHRLDREKQLPVDDAVRIAIAVAGALDYAHRHGVIHRDLKPENILLHEQQPLVADFGIALAVSNAAGNRITQTGFSLGTPQYMSPEQATGDRAIDGRTDIYSLGALLYEMLTGEPPHSGTTAQAIIARVLTEKPRSVRLSRETVSEQVEWAVERALAKLPADRWATAHDFAAALGSQRLTPAMSEPRRAETGTTPRRSRLMPWVGALLGFAVGAAAATWLAPRQAPNGPPIRFVVNLDEKQRFIDASMNMMALSPNGMIITFVATATSGGQKLFVRTLGELDARELAGTDDASQPFFSPDGKWIGFYAKQQLMKVPVEGGTPALLAEVPTLTGASWGTDERIVVSTDGELATVPSAGGAVKVFARADTSAGERLQRLPLALPDGNTVLYQSWSSASAQGGRLAVSFIDGRKSQILELPGWAALAVIDGNLVYGTASNAIMSVPFDAKQQRVTGTPVQLIAGVSGSAGGAIKASVSRSGSIAYVREHGGMQVVLADARGDERVLLPAGRQYAHPRFSPNGQQLAVMVLGSSGSDIHIFDIASGTFTRLTSGGSQHGRPEWTSDGRRVLFTSNRDSTQALWWQPADHSGPAELLFRQAGINAGEGTVSQDGQTLVFRVDGVGARHDVWYKGLGRDTTARPLITSAGAEYAPRISPDGKWVAFVSAESGAAQAYITPFPGPGPRHQVSVAGGNTPVWSRDGHRLIYAEDQRLIAATLTLSPAFAIPARDTVPSTGLVTAPYYANYDISPDGQRLVFVKSAGPGAQIVVVHDWKTELRERTAAKTR